jgi:hypothetical protein
MQLADQVLVPDSRPHPRRNGGEEGRRGVLTPIQASAPPGRCRHCGGAAARAVPAGVRAGADTDTGTGTDRTQDTGRRETPPCSCSRWRRCSLLALETTRGVTRRPVILECLAGEKKAIDVALGAIQNVTGVTVGEVSLKSALVAE